MTVADIGPPPPVVLEAPEALVYANDPVTDNGELTRVTMHGSTAEDGRLTSEWVEVFNCLNEDGGAVAMPSLGGFNLTISLCNEVQVARPDADGHFLSISPPEDDSDPNDSFAEVMMYHHVNLVHDYFKNTHGFSELDYPLPALVNVQVKIDPPLPFFMAGPDGWVSLSNAAFFPREAWRQFASQFGLPPRDSDSIIFFLGEQDFAYDSRVIYHEYTHAVVGTARLSVMSVLDQYGLEFSPRSMNEGLADFFAASLADDPVIGNYVGVMGTGLRDLSIERRCPEHMVDEVHAQGELIGSTLWEVRETVGAVETEAIVYLALEQFTRSTGHARAAELMLASAADMGVEIEAQVRQIFEARGFGECERSTEYRQFRARTAGLPHLVEGTQTSGFTGLRAGVPAFKQFYVDVDADTPAVKLSWRLGAGGQDPFGGGGEVGPLDISIRKGAPVHLSTTPSLSYTEDSRVQPPLAGDRQDVILAGDCLPEGGGRVHTLFINTGPSQLQLMTMDIERLEQIPGDGFVHRCGGEEPAEPGPGADGGAPAADAGAASDAGVPAPQGDAGPSDAGVPNVDAGGMVPGPDPDAGASADVGL